MGPYILDFYCPAAKLCLEVDGQRHGLGDQPERDERRDRWLAAQGVEVMRIPALRIYEDVDDVVVGIEGYLLTLIGRC